MSTLKAAADMPDIPEGSIIITPDQMYRESNEKFGKIDTKLDAIARDFHGIPATVRDHGAYIDTLKKVGLPERFADLEKEVATLKGNWKWLAGLGAAVALIVGVFGAVIASAITGT